MFIKRRDVIYLTRRLALSSQTTRGSLFSTTSAPLNKQAKYKVTFKTTDGDEIVCYGKKDEHLLDIAHGNNVDLEGACEASLACSTCHVIVESDHWAKLPEASDEENDMLDLAFGLGCQVKMCAELDGLVVRIPSATRNMAVDGYKPKPH